MDGEGPQPCRERLRLRRIDGGRDRLSRSGNDKTYALALLANRERYVQELQPLVTAIRTTVLK